MGACSVSFITQAVDVKALLARFEDHQAMQKVEFGADAYGGNMGLAKGLTVTNRTFMNEKEASKWLGDQAQKWGQRSQ